MISCLQCTQKPAAASLALCTDCIRQYPDTGRLLELHARLRKKLGLTPRPPKSSGGLPCRICVNECVMCPGESGYCGLRRNEEGHLVEKAGEGSALAHMYLDALPTNCCAAWFCRGSGESGYNLAFFFYGCSFDCFYCQNMEHKFLDRASNITEEELVGKALESRVRCVCFFGGSPEPQISFALHSAERIFQEGGAEKHICWEWNGSGVLNTVKRAAELSKKSGGTVKFDLKAFDPKLHHALCGIDNARTLRNFKLLAEMFPEDDTITATTLLVPYYVDRREVEAIASFIASINPRIPYSLLVFHPDFYLDDLPITPREQVYECYDAACKHLERVYIGNRQLL